MKNNYEILGLKSNASDEEVDKKYYELRAKYSEDRFLEGEAGNIAAKKLTELDAAYREITAKRKEAYFTSGDSTAFSDIENDIKNGNLTDAQQKLDAFNDRNAEWHYLQAVIFYKKNWNNESKKQLEIAMQMDSSNDKYKTAYEKLNGRMNSSTNFNSANKSGEKYKKDYEFEDRQMGGEGCFEWCCEMAVCNMALNCCCNSCR